MSTKPTKKNKESELLQEQIIKLEKQLESFKHSNDHFLKNKLFLHYDIKEPEKVVVDCETKLPVLAEVDKKKIQKGKESDPTHMLLEGENYHALSVLNYTHAGKIDLIYIDPPYNTKNSYFIYNDKRVDREDSFTHSKWLAFMDKRLRLAKNLLADTGVIFISIDDNEQAHLRLLCDQIFGERKFIGMFKWNRVAKAPSLSDSIRNKYEYVLAYFKNERIELFGKNSYNTQGPLWHLPNKRNELVFPERSIKVKQSFDKGDYGGSYKVELLDDLIEENGFNKQKVRVKAHSAWGQTKIDQYVKDGFTFEIKKSPATFYTTLSSEGNFIAPSDLITKEECGVDNNTDASDALKAMGISFDNPKPVSLISYLVNMATHANKSAIILDFFAGSGTTGHAVLKLNAQDSGTRQFILCTNNENKIAENVTYPRIKKVIDGYGDTAGIPANLRYFQTDFVEKKGSASQLKIDLTRQCADMLCVKENVFEVVKLKKSAKNYKFFKNGDKYLGVFFDFFTDPEFTDFIAELNKLPQEAEKAVYIFVLDGSASIFADEFAGVANCEIKEIPQKILDIYKKLAREVARK
jgi:adenine-specific DNA-methyltransferase